MPIQQESLPGIPEVEKTAPVERVKKPVERVKTERHLKWYQTQYWSGFISGLWFGLMCGLPFAFVVYQVAKVVVHFIEGA